MASQCLNVFSSNCNQKIDQLTNQSNYERVLVYHPWLIALEYVVVQFCMCVWFNAS